MYLLPGAVHNVLHEERYSPRSLLEWIGQVSFNLGTVRFQFIEMKRHV